MTREDTESVPLCVEQFERAHNMTDVDTALRTMLWSPAEAAREPAEKALTAFYNKWVNEALVIDRWFALQAMNPTPGALARVEALMQHEAFNIKVPNRMRALVSNFAASNLVNFHQADGKGYAFLADRVIELNAINPQMAARTMGPLTRWGKFDPARQQLMKGELERIVGIDNISPDVYEIASKSLS